MHGQLLGSKRGRGRWWLTIDERPPYPITLLVADVEVDFPRVISRVFRDDKLGEGDEDEDAACDGAHDESGVVVGGGGQQRRGPWFSQ